MNGIFDTPDIKWIGVMRGIWGLYWVISAAGVKSTQSVENPRCRIGPR